MISIDKTFFLQLFNFILLMIVLNYLLYRPLLNIIEKRKKILESSAEEVQRLNKTIEEKQLEYEEKLRLAKQQAMELKAQILKEANDEAKAMIDQVRAKIPAMMAEVQARVTKEMEVAREILRGSPESYHGRLPKKYWEGVSNEKGIFAERSGGDCGHGYHRGPCLCLRWGRGAWWRKVGMA